MSEQIQQKKWDWETDTITHFSSFGKGDMGNEVRNEVQNESEVFSLVEEKDENIPKKIRSIFELYTKNVLIEAIFTSLKNEESQQYSVSMRGLFHCQNCLDLWRKGYKDAPSCCVEPAALAQDNLVHLGRDEARHIIKLLSDECFTDELSATDVLNSLNESEDVDGEFRLLPGKDLKSSANYFGPVLMRSQNGRTASGTFSFIPKNGRYSMLFSPIFNRTFVGKKKLKIRSTPVPIFEKNLFSCSRHATNKQFCLASGHPLDPHVIFSTGLVALTENRQFFFSGKMKQESFLPSACVTDTGVIYQWRRRNSDTKREKFENIGEIFAKTRKAFPEFPSKNLSQKCEWKFVLNRKLADLPTKFLKTGEKETPTPCCGVVTIYLGGELDERGALQTKSKFSISTTKNVRLRIWPKSTGFRQINFKTFSDFESESSFLSTVDGRSSTTDCEDDLDIDDAMLQPSGTPAGEPISRSSRNLNNDSPSSCSLRKLDSGKRSTDSLGRTPSVVSFRELDSAGERELLQRRSKNLLPRNQEGVLNPVVRNRTGKPMTKPGTLADNASAARGQGETTQITPRSASMSQRRDSAVISNTKFQNYDTSGYSVPNRVTSSQTGVGSRTSARNFDPSKRKSTMLGEGSKAATPSTFARQREIQKKTKREKEEVKAKYQDAAHHSIRTGADPEQLTLGVTKTSAAALTAMEQMEQLPAQEETDTKIPVMKAFTGEIKVPKPRRKARKGASSKIKVDDLLAESKEDITVPEKNTNETDELFDDINNEFIQDFFLSDDEDYDYSDLSSLSDLEDEDSDRKKKNKSSFFPFLDGMTVLNFTENFSFSYFVMPGYVKEKNKNIKRGILKLPVIETSEKDKKFGRRKRKDKTGLMKRIDKLNKFDGATDARVRQ